MKIKKPTLSTSLPKQKKVKLKEDFTTTEITQTTLNSTKPEFLNISNVQAVSYYMLSFPQNNSRNKCLFYRSK